MRIFIVMASLVLFAGCSVQSSQLSAVMDLINKPSTNVPLNSWSVKYGDYEAIIYPVTLPEGTLFSNSTGDQILFDGWSVRRFSGLGLNGSPVRISDATGERNFMRGNRSLALHKCDQWKHKQQFGKKQFIQSCNGAKVYSNSILVDKEGSIVVIRQIVDERYNSLILTRLN
jgi:hypothetical protein